MNRTSQTFQSSTSNGHADIKREDPQLHVARILTTDHFYTSLTNRTRKILPSRQVLTGCVRNDRFAEMKGSNWFGVSTDIVAFPRDVGSAYLVIINQLNSWQHRFVVPLYDPNALGFLTKAFSGALLTGLTTEDDSRRMLLEIDLQPLELSMLAGTCIDLDYEMSPQFGVDLAELLAESLMPDFVASSILGEVVREVDVSVLLPAPKSTA